MPRRDNAVVIVLVVVVILFLASLGGGMMMWPAMIGWRGYHFGAWEIGMIFGMLLFWALLIGGIVWLVRQAWPSSTGQPVTGHRALDILKERYAKGEVTREQYEEMRRDLQQ